ncbi:MAG: hypothetical protein KGL52_17920 [Rhodospirillales bacterium]|nr:hypothetical protein [Rhodospirillales bacterium]
MNSLSAVSAGIALQAPLQTRAQGSTAPGSKPDGDGDHGVEPTRAAQPQGAQSAAQSAGNAGASGIVNLTA